MEEINENLQVLIYFDSPLPAILDKELSNKVFPSELGNKVKNLADRKSRSLHLSNYFEANAHLEDKEQFDSCTYQISSEEQDAKELQEEVLGEQ